MRISNPKYIAEICAYKSGYKYYKVKINGKIRRIYKFNYFFSNVGEAYVLSFFYWLPESKRKRCSDSDKPNYCFSTFMCIDCEPQIKKMIHQLKTTGYTNLDKIDFRKGKKWQHC